MRFLILFILILTSVLCEVKSARILGVFPMPSKSHQFVFRSYTQELAKRGHELVIITPDPVLNGAAYNVTEIDVSFVYNEMSKIVAGKRKKPKRGVLMNVDSVLEHKLFLNLLSAVVSEFKSPQVQKLLNDKTQKFDLVVVEGFFEYQLIVTEIFEAPVILFSSLMGFQEHYEMMGAVGRHPILYPNFHRMNYADLSFWGMLKEIFYEIKLYRMMREVETTQDKLLKENFGPDAPTSAQLKKNVDLLFLNSYANFANNMPVPPNIVYLGATHLQPAKEIPKDLADYLNKSTRGVIYVSFGSNIRPSLMDKDFLAAFLQAFEALPYDILWRFDGESLENIPKNLMWQKWFPQRDLLFHPNIKAFVTQCGIQSTDEAIDAEVPLIGVPMMAEQWYNAQKYVDFGIGVKLDPLSLTADDLVQGVLNVVGNESYKENIKRLKAINNDQPQKPLEKAVWWTEYLLRHGGAKHLRSPTADMPWTEYYMLNIVLPIVGAVTLILIAMVFALRKLYILAVRTLLSQNKFKKS